MPKGKKKKKKLSNWKADYAVKENQCSVETSDELGQLTWLQALNLYLD